MLHNYTVYVKIMYWTRYLLERIGMKRYTYSLLKVN